MSLPGLLVFAWSGSVIGDNIGYLVGRTVGRTVILRYGAKIGLDDARFTRIEGIFKRYGAATVAFARFFNILRQLNGIATHLARRSGSPPAACRLLSDGAPIVHCRSGASHSGRRGNRGGRPRVAGRCPSGAVPPTSRLNPISCVANHRHELREQYR
jgi:hypothetical protein